MSVELGHQHEILVANFPLFFVLELPPLLGALLVLLPSLVSFRPPCRLSLYLILSYLVLSHLILPCSLLLTCIYLYLCPGGDREGSRVQVCCGEGESLQGEESANMTEIATLMFWSQ